MFQCHDILLYFLRVNTYFTRQADLGAEVDTMSFISTNFAGTVRLYSLHCGVIRRRRPSWRHFFGLRSFGHRLALHKNPCYTSSRDYCFLQVGLVSPRFSDTTRKHWLGPKNLFAHISAVQVVVFRITIDSQIPAEIWNPQESFGVRVRAHLTGQLSVCSKVYQTDNKGATKALCITGMVIGGFSEQKASDTESISMSRSTYSHYMVNMVSLAWVSM